MPYDATRSRPTPRRRIAIVSTYPPKLCGLATFSAALGASLVRQGHLVEVMAVGDGTDRAFTRQPVIGEIVNGDSRSVRRASARLSLCDAVLVQHEYGIFGGEDGREVLDLVDGITAPVISVLHTVPRLPTPGQRDVLTTLCNRSAGVVVMSQQAQERLTANYAVDVSKVLVIPHGAAAVTDTIASAGGRRVQPRSGTDLRLLTWGLIGPGKGIEHAIDALALLGSDVSRLTYTVAGVTHPKVLAHSGDAYRASLIDRVRANGLEGRVVFDQTYRDVAALTRYIATADVVVLPYDSPDQVTSGVLVDSLAAGRPVLATRFPHAVELLSGGAGMLVPHDDPAALADALRQVIDDPSVVANMAAAARRVAPSLSWSAVSRQYTALVSQVLGELASAAR